MPHSIRPHRGLQGKGNRTYTIRARRRWMPRPAHDLPRICRGQEGRRDTLMAQVVQASSTRKGAHPWDTHPSPPRTILRAAFIGRNIRPSVSSGGQRNPWFPYHSPSPLLGSTTTNFAPMESASSTDRSMASETSARPTPLPWQPTSTARRPMRIAGKDTLLIPDLTLFGTEKLSIDVIERQKRPTRLPSDTHAYTLHISLTCQRSA